MKITDSFVIKMLIEQDYITSEDLEKAIEKVGEQNVIEYFIKNEILSRSLIVQAISEYLDIEYFNTNSTELTLDDLEKLPRSLIEKYMVIYLGETRDTVKLALAKPELVEDFGPDIVRVFPDKKFDIKFILEDDFTQLIASHRKPLQERFAKIMQDTKATTHIFEEIIEESFHLKATDIHFEPQHDEQVIIRLRIDGLLEEVAVIDMKSYMKIINRVKVLAKLQLDEHYKAQDGAIRIKTDKYAMDLRVSIVPTLEGSKISIRVLSDYIKALSLGDLGLTQDGEMMIKNVLDNKQGMILNTGPTGSGKTTTLYAILKNLQNPTVNITTIEDPVEYRVPGINQIQVDPVNDITFAKGLRSIVRQDPDVILVGEIRDEETAEISVNAALTGHLVLSTFHANDAATAIPRLIDMGIDPFLLASTLNLIISQRLVRKICLDCITSQEYTHTELKEWVEDPKQYFTKSPVRLYSGSGCSSCNYTGYKGRLGIYEMIYITDAIKELIETYPTTAKVWKVAKSDGCKTFFEEGIEKVQKGQTTLEELLRVAPISLIKKFNDAKETKANKSE